MKSIRTNDSSNLSLEFNKDASSQPARGILSAFLDYLKARQQLAVVTALGTCAILSALFLYLCVRAMIPVEGLNNWQDVRVGADFIVFYSSALLALGGEAALAYDQAILNAFQYEILGIEAHNLAWYYPPVNFLFLIPFTSLSYLEAFWAWTILTTLSLMIVIRQITPIWYIPLLVPLCFPVAYSMVAGQNGVLTAAIIGAGLIMLPRSATVAGLLFGLLIYKPQLAVVIPFCLLAGRHYRTFVSMAVSAVALILMSWLVFGIEPWIAFIHGMVHKSDSLYGPALDVWARIPTVIIMALQVFESSKIAWILQACVSVTAITIAAWVWSTSAKPGTLALALVAATPLVSPHILDYDMAILIIPIAFLAKDAWGGKWTAGRFILLLSMWTAEPMLRILSEKIGLQLGPFLWTVMLGYSVFLVMKEQGGIVKQEISGYRRQEIR